MIKIKKKILVTCALPYANGPIHLGHLLEHIQADIWVRIKKMQGNKIYFICADDAHGTPIMLKSKNMGIKPEKMIKKINKEHKDDFKKFFIKHDNYHTTHSKENKFFSNLIYKKLKKKKFIFSKKIKQLFDYKKKIFLPDRFVIGKCPKCLSKNQYGDNCEKCSYNYNSIKLINPISILSNTKPIIKKTKHYFFNLPLFKKKIKLWIKNIFLEKKILNKIKEWFKFNLKSWDISRDTPYFGFKIPNTIKKYFYVWFDAHIGYISSFSNLCKKKNINFKEFWNINTKTELYHFIGKDIIFFHSFFWPAILEGINFRKPNNLFVHGYLTINGNKMSKSKGTFIKAKTYLKYFKVDYLRYYFASKLSSKINDINFNLEHFKQKINSELINKIFNLASRSSSFINKIFNNKLSNKIYNKKLYFFFIKQSKFILNAYNKRNTNQVIIKILKLTDIANKYINDNKPWLIYKKNNKDKKINLICSMGIQLFRILMIYLKPIIPNLVKKTEFFLNNNLDWKNIKKPLKSHYINKFKILCKRIDKKDIYLISKDLFN